MRLSIMMMVTLLPLAGTATAAGVDIDPRQIMERVKERPDGEDRHAVMSMMLVGRDGYRRERRLEYQEKDYEKERKTRVYIEEPRDLKGTAVLIYGYDEREEAEDDIWLYLPSMRKSKRIAAKSKRGRFVGSEFSFADLERIHVSDYDYALLGKETIGGRPAHKLQATATKDATREKTGYTKRLIWVDAERFVILKDVYYDLRGLELKTFTAEKVEKIADYWTVTKAHMENVQTGDHTYLEMATIQYDVGLSNDTFTKARLARGL